MATLEQRLTAFAAAIGADIKQINVQLQGLGGGTVAWSQLTGVPETATRWPKITEVGGVNPKPARVASGFLRDDGMWANGYHNSLILYADNPAGGGRYIRVGILSNTSRKVPDGNMYLDFFSANSVAPADPQLRLIRWAGANGIGELVHRGSGQMRLWALGDAQLHFGSGGISRMYYDPATQGWSIPASGGLRIGGHVTHHDGNDARLITSDTDPGAIGAGAVWVRTSHPMGLHVRSSDNSGWIRIGGGGMQIQKQQIFTTSGTFTPPPGMIAQGGHCEVFLVGGGQNAGGYYFGSSIGAATEWHGKGGAGGAITRKILHGIIQPQHVYIGAGSVAHVTDGGGGRKNIGTTSGGTTLFGLAARANGGGISMTAVATGGTCSFGEEASSAKGVIRPRHPGVDGYGQGGYGVLTYGSGIVTSNNSGNGGSFAPDKLNGSNGICIVTWWESVE